MRSSLILRASEPWKLWTRILILAVLAALRLNIVTADTPSAPRLMSKPVVLHQVPEDHADSATDSDWWCNG
jgi:hypothetical protein